MKDRIELFIKAIENAKTIAICGHKNPDGDSLCSALALMKIIELNFNKKPVVMYDGNIPKGLEYVPLRKDAVYYENVPTDSKFDLFIVVDYGTKKHLAGAESFINNSEQIVEIDHHFNDDLIGQICFDNTTKAATSQIIFDIVRCANFKTDIDIVNLLTLAIITDTGHFKFAKTPDVFTDVAELVSMGANMSNLMNLLLNKDKKTVLIESLTASNAEFFMRGRLAVAKITKSDYKKLDGRGDLVLSLLGQIHGVEYIVLLKEQKENQIGISIRSRSTPINHIAESFGGGGHLCAAGAVVADSLDNVYQNIINAFKGL